MNKELLCIAGRLSTSLKSVQGIFDKGREVAIFTSGVIQLPVIDAEMYSSVLLSH